MPYIKPPILFALLALAAILFFFIRYARAARACLSPFPEPEKKPLSFAGKCHPMEKKDRLPILLITLIYALTAFFQLGARNTPQLVCEFGPSLSYTIQISGGPVSVSGFRYFSGLGTGSYNIEVSSDGEKWFTLWQRKEDPNNKDKVTGYYFAKAEDFPELGEGKKVSWTVEYGKTVKPITDPKGTTIASVKSEIETSKAFLDNLKKAKNKNPDCLVKPKVTAQSKGIAAYKGVFSSLEEARASGKAICTIPGGDGRVYELRKSELGEFIAPKENVIDLPTVVTGFTPALPLVPMALLAQIISFFRCCMSGPEEFEALAHIFWDRQEEKFVAHIPKQRVTKAHIDADLSQDGLPEDRYLHYIDIHSHNSMTYVHDLDSKAFTRTLWQMCTECIVVFPDGVNVLPWMLCGTNEIGEATAEQMGTARLVVWAQHGIYGAGKDLDETFGLIETAEKAAEIYMKIAHLPLKTTITDDQMHQLEKHFGVKAREGWLD